jgi:hypothetical protein
VGVDRIHKKRNGTEGNIWTTQDISWACGAKVYLSLLKSSWYKLQYKSVSALIED